MVVNVNESSRQRAQSLLRSAVVWDNHGCMPLRTDARFLPQLERYRKAGVTVASLNIGFAESSTLEHLRVLSFMRQWIDKHQDHYRLIATVADVHRCKADGKLGVVFDIEGMYPVQADVSFVQTFYELGVRWMLIAYNRANRAGSGCLDNGGGLTSVGRAIINDMERVGMVLCLSHAHPTTVAEALDYSSKPTIFSHSNPHGDNPHPRNVSDELMRRCARKGGVIGLSGIGSFLGTRGTQAELADRLLQQIRYVVDRVGPEHVGLGLDFVFDPSELDDYLKSTPELFAASDRWPGPCSNLEPEAIAAITEGLARTHLSDDQIRGILGENWLRVATQVWQ